jgi:hypothetical protein
MTGRGREVNIDAWSPSLTVHHIRNCLFCLYGSPGVVIVRTTDKPEVLIKLKLQASSTRTARGCTLLVRTSSARPRAFRLAGRMFRRTRRQPFWGRGIDRLVFLELSNMQHGYLASGSEASVAPSASDKTHLFLLACILLRVRRSCTGHSRPCRHC